MMWEVWEWNGQYIKGNRLKRTKNKQTAVEHAKKAIEYKKMVKGGKNKFYLEDEDGRPIGMIINKEK